MVQGLLKTRLGDAFGQKTGGCESMPAEDRKRNIIDVKEWFRIKWKFAMSAVALLASLFVFTGVIIYINIQSSDYCHREKLNVHIIPYLSSGFDPYITPEQFYDSDLHETLDFVVNELKVCRQRKYTISETYYFWKWWQYQPESVRNDVRGLIKTGQLEIAGGGWCLPDEAVIHYTNYIDQFTLGLRRLKEIVGRQMAPDISFLMDNYGHSKDLASLQRDMDIRGLLLGGISPSEQCYRKSFRRMEFLWSDSNGMFFETRHSQKPNIFTSILDDKALESNSYFTYEKPLIDLEGFRKSMFCQAGGYGTNNIFLPIGRHFRISSTKNIFKVGDHLIRLMKNNSQFNLNVMYSSPSYYLNALEYSHGKWRKSCGEFLPYAENRDHYWTGYYSSRPALKYLERLTSRFLQIFNQLAVSSELGSKFTDQLDRLKEATALAQHYCAVTGIASQTTTNYFYHLLTKSMTDSKDAISKLLNKLVLKTPQASQLMYESCLKLNISECDVSEKNQNFIVTVYNPSSNYTNQYVRIPVTKEKYLVRTRRGEKVTSQVLKISNSIKYMQGRKSEADFELVFRATDIPPLGFRSYYVSQDNSTKQREQITYQNKKFQLKINQVRGEIVAVERDSVTYPLLQELMVYDSWESRNSVFKPETRAQPLSTKKEIQVLNDGELVTEYEQNFDTHGSQIVRVYKDEDFIEFQWIIQPLSISFTNGKEVVVMYRTNIKNRRFFYSDSNGRGIHLRQREPEMEKDSTGNYIARNYRPVNCRIAIADPNYQLHVFNDRVQGGGSLAEGDVELMVHRRLLSTAYLSRNEDLDERVNSEGMVVTGQHWVFISSSNDVYMRDAIENYSTKSRWEPWYFFADASNVSFVEWQDNYISEYSALQSSLPKRLKILSLEPWAGNQILLRLENTGTIRLGVRLKDLFNALAVVNGTEVALAGTEFKGNRATDLKFEPNAGEEDGKTQKLKNLDVSVPAEDIKTYILDVHPLYKSEYEQLMLSM